MRMPSIPRNWLDLAALVDPIGHRTDPLAEGRSLDWYGIYALAASQLIAPTLYAILVESGRLSMAPPDVQDALQQLHGLNAERNDRQRSVLIDTTRILNDHGIEPLLLKGAIALLPGTSAQPTTRMMSDLDIALRNAEPAQGEQALIEAGYWHANNQGPQQYSEKHHLAPLFHPRGTGYVEIHRELLTPAIPATALSLDEVRTAAQKVEWNDLRLWVPSIEHRLIHNALHHQVQDAQNYLDRCSLRQLMDFVQLRASPAAAGIDWPEQIRRLDGSGLGDALRDYLLLAFLIFGQPLPSGVIVNPRIYRTERRRWFWARHPRLSGGYRFSKRLKRLPRKLVTPSWYPQKYRQLRRDWEINRPRAKPAG